MEISPETKRLDQVVQGVTVKAPHPFAEGHQLTADQAGFLNRSLATRIGQTLGQRIKKEHESLTAKEKEAAAKEGREPVLVSLEDHVASKDIQALLDADYADFDFSATRGPGAAPVDPVARLARTMAEAKVKTLPAVIKHGVGKLMKSKASEGTDYRNKWDELVSQYLGRHPEIVDAAREQLASQPAPEENYDELLGNLEEIKEESAGDESGGEPSGDQAAA